MFGSGMGGRNVFLYLFDSKLESSSLTGRCWRRGMDERNCEVNTNRQNEGVWLQHRVDLDGYGTVAKAASA